VQPDRNMTGPSLAGVWGRKAGSLPSFQRYSPALKESDVTWTEEALDPWLQDPANYIPGNRMTFPGIKDAQARTDLIAYLKSASETGQAQGGAPGAPMGDMMMAGRPVPNLRKLDPEDRVQSIAHCGDTYRVTTADGETHEFWERNLRFKTDSGPDGPEKGAPAILGAGMMGDRASVIFAAPEEISAWIRPQC
jgi:cytochrome c